MRVPALILGVAAACVVAALSSPPPKRQRGPHQAPLLPRAELLLRTGAFFPQLLADYYWIQTIQATGVARTADEYKDIYFYADLATDLDPTFFSVYSFAGAAIPHNLGRETWVNTEESTRLLEKGHRLFPNSVSLSLLLAYNYSYFHKRHQEAAKLLQVASKLPGAPAYLPQLATRLFSQARDFDSGLALATSMRDSAVDPAVREEFDRRVKELQLERVLTQVEEACARFKVEQGRAAANVDELVSRGFLPQAPVDPLGGEISIDSNGTASSTSQSRRLRVFDPLLDEP